MERIKQRFSSSVMRYITLSLATIFGVALLTIFISFWVTELADKDAQAINLSGSMRMQTYRAALALEQGDGVTAKRYIDELHQTWNHTLFSAQQLNDANSPLNQRFDTAYQHWAEVVRPLLLKTAAEGGGSLPYPLLEKQVALTDQLVAQFQKDAERKIRNLRSIQLIALFTTILVGSLIFHLLKNRVERPLAQLTQTARQIGKGDFDQRVDVEGKDELALLGEVFNQMCESIGTMYGELEQRVESRTLELQSRSRELQQNNTALAFLFNTARKILDSQQQPLDYQQVLDELTEVLQLGPARLELCLFTPQGERPYLHIAPQREHPSDCRNRSCAECRATPPAAGVLPLNAIPVQQYPERFTITRNETQYGIINIRAEDVQRLDGWQERLLCSVADQLAIALSLAEQKDQEHRLAMLNERTVIARELHDSLAQALSYLQIQVTRLQKSHDKQKYELQQPIIDELREGLSAAYRQLRELLTTFRLKMDVNGLRGALESTVAQLQERSDMQVNLEYRVSDLPLSPMEEIHLLQIVREASQNAISHSRGSRVDIRLRQEADKSIELIIEDDGVGIPDSPEKLNHYGLAIMNERSRHLGGQVDISPRAEGGTRVAFRFLPSFLAEQSRAVL